MSRHRAPEPERTRPDFRATMRGWNAEGVHPGLALLSLLCVIGLAMTLLLLAGSDRVSRPPGTMGDFLGPESGESVADYRARAEGTLDSLADDGAEAQAAHWALVTFDPPADVATAAAAVEGFDSMRVATVLVGPVASRDMPEPVAGQRRYDVIERAVASAGRSAGAGDSADGPRVNGLVVRGTLGQLRVVRGRPGVAVVEALPADAVRGRFGVRALSEMEDPAPAQGQGAGR